MLPIRNWTRDRRILLKDQCVLHNPAQVRLAQDDNLSTHLLRIGPINLSAKPVRSAMANFQGPIRRANRRVHREEITQNDLWELAADSDFGSPQFSCRRSSLAVQLTASLFSRAMVSPG